MCWWKTAPHWNHSGRYSVMIWFEACFENICCSENAPNSNCGGRYSAAVGFEAFVDQRMFSKHASNHIITEYLPLWFQFGAFFYQHIWKKDAYNPTAAEYLPPQLEFGALFDATPNIYFLCICNDQLCFERSPIRPSVQYLCTVWVSKRCYKHLSYADSESEFKGDICNSPKHLS